NGLSSPEGSSNIGYIHPRLVTTLFLPKSINLARQFSLPAEGKIRRNDFSCSVLAVAMRGRHDSSHLCASPSNCPVHRLGPSKGDLISQSAVSRRSPRARRCRNGEAPIADRNRRESAPC